MSANHVTRPHAAPNIPLLHNKPTKVLLIAQRVGETTKGLFCDKPYEEGTYV